MKEAKESLDETLRILNEAKARLREVEEGIAALQAKYEECVAKKEELKEKCDLCSARLSRAEKVRSFICAIKSASSSILACQCYTQSSTIIKPLGMTLLFLSN